MDLSLFLKKEFLTVDGLFHPTARPCSQLLRRYVMSH
jgi:hypothetical protein